MEFTTSPSTAQGSENFFFPSLAEEKPKKKPKKSKKQKRRHEETTWIPSINEAKKKIQDELSQSVNLLLDDLLPDESTLPIAKVTFDEKIATTDEVRASLLTVEDVISDGDHFIAEEEPLSKTASEQASIRGEETSLTTYEKQLTRTLPSNVSEEVTSPTLYEKRQQTASSSNTDQLHDARDDLFFSEETLSTSYDKQQPPTCPSNGSEKQLYTLDDLHFRDDTLPTETRQIAQNELTLKTSITKISALNDVFHAEETSSIPYHEKRTSPNEPTLRTSVAGESSERNGIFLGGETSPPRYERIQCAHEPTSGTSTVQSAGDAQYFAKEMLVDACELTGNAQVSTSTPVDKVKQSRKHKPREIYNQVEVTHTVKETENGTILSISVKAPKFLNYAIVNIHKESSCQCVIKDIFPLGTTQHKRSFDMNWNVSKVSKQCKIATNVSQMSE